MPVSPTSIRLTTEQAEALAALVLDLPTVRPDLAALDPLTPGTVLRLAVARGLAELRADLDRATAAKPAFEPSAAVAPIVRNRGQATTVTLEARGTRYRVTAWRASDGSRGAAWPDGRRGGLAWGDLSPHAPPALEWLAANGCAAGDAAGVAEAVARAWAALD